MSVLIKTTILDVPFLEVMLPHMIAQAGVAYRECIVVVDPRPEFAGKYRSRPRGTRQELDAVLSRLVAGNWVNRVLEVPSRRSEVDTVMTKYFMTDGERVPTHAFTGGPVFATLFGLEAASTDFVVAMDADMFFHAKAGSWVRQGLELFADPKTWLVMTQNGPPAAAVGTLDRLGPKNAKRATWDAKRRLYCFKNATTRYFLTDRRRLRGKIPVMWKDGQVWPLEQCISAGLRKHRATRLCLALEGSWDLHAFWHGDPFPAWAPHIAALVERGEFPSLQRGEYDLRLDRRASRAAWQALIDARPTTVNIPRELPKSVIEPTPAAEYLPIAVVVAIRDRAGTRVSNMLASLAWQMPRRVSDVVVVSLGSQPEINVELASLCCQWGARLVTHGSPTQPWCKPLASNIGIRSICAQHRFIVSLDSDMILAPDFLDVVFKELSANPRSLILCQILDLQRGQVLPMQAESLLAELPRLREHTNVRPCYGTGAMQAATREFFFEVRGYDEDLIWWGAEDGDMVVRAKRAGLRVKWITDYTYMLHQWHPKRHLALSDGAQRKAAAAAWTINHQLVKQRQSVIRNPHGWGGLR